MKTPKLLTLVAAGIAVLGPAALALPATQAVPSTRALPVTRAVSAANPVQRNNDRPAVRAIMARHPLLRVLNRLGLTVQQRQQARQAVQVARANVRAIRANTALTPQQKRVQLRAVRTTLRQEILSLLTPVQRRKLARIRSQMAQQRPLRALRQLNLTVEQKADVRAILRNQRPKVQAIRAGSGTPMQKRAALLQLRRETRQRILALLTPEQRRKLAQARARQRLNM